nr:NADH dehydrogenase subunit 5 [Paradorydium reflexanum]
MINLYYWLFLIFMSFSFIMFLFFMYFMITSTSLFFEWTFFEMNSISFSYVIYMDWVSSCFIFVVFFISSLVVLYSMDYMGYYNNNSIRFLILILLFVLSMLLMVISPNMISIMLGWDGLGLVSYCLVIYYMSMTSYVSGMLTCLINRMGDIGLLVTIGWMLNYGSWNFMFYIDFLSESVFYLLIISCFTKSAQIPFSMWLPAAMAAPTPVSALVHSSTLVTAGVYLLIRFFNYIYMYNMIFMTISLMTMFMSSLFAMFEYDLKKIIAFSTLSQLGLMMSSLFSGMLDLTFFHLVSHAMFKSLLFLCAGIIIHMMNGCQDIRYMGSMCMSLPLTCCCFNISNLSLCGFPFLSGFYSKDLIFEYVSFSGLNLFYYFIFYLSISLTLFYSFRLFYYTMMLKFNYFNPLFFMNENMILMSVSISILTGFSLTFGCFYMWFSDLSMLFIMLPLFIKLMSIIILMLGLLICLITRYLNLMIYLNSFFISLNGSMWFMYGYSYYLFMMNYNFSYVFMSKIYWGEYYGGLGLSFYLLKLGNYLQMYSLSSYKMSMFLFLVWMLLMV